MEEYNRTNFPDPKNGKELYFYIEKDGRNFKELMEIAEEKGWHWATGGLPTSITPAWIGHGQGCIIFRIKEITHFQDAGRDRATATFTPGSTSTPLHLVERNILCPLCGKAGDDLAFAFYCTNEGCSNYKD